MSKLRDFIHDIIHKDLSVDDVLSNSASESEKGCVYERLWDLVIKFGFCEKFPKSRYDNLTGNANNCNLTPVQSIKHYIDNNIVNSSNSGGYSDISLYDKETSSYIFITCKYYSEAKTVNKYGVQEICTLANSKSNIYTSWMIYIIVANKHDVLKKVKNARKSSEPITKHMRDDTILDKSDLEHGLAQFKAKLQNFSFDKYDDTFHFNKIHLSLRFHQQLIVSKTSRLIEEGNKQFLWGCKCRSGKTYIAGGLIADQKDIITKFNALIITPAPTETLTQFTTDLFNKYNDFSNCKVIPLSNQVLNSLSDICEDKNIFIASKQFLQYHLHNNKIQQLNKLNIIIFDENHFIGCTQKSKDILDTYSSSNTVKIYLTATYDKPLREWNISDECRMYWDIEDEQWCKARDIDKLKEKHGEYDTNYTLDIFQKLGMSVEQSLICYDNYPNLLLITNMFDPQRYNSIKQEIMDSKYGFSFDVLFAIAKGRKKSFEYPEQVKLFLRYISGSRKETDFKHGDKSIFSRVYNHCQNNDSRRPFTQLWFLPENNIDIISKCLKEIMENYNILKHYNVIILNSKQDVNKSEIKQYIEYEECIAQSKGQNGVIILVGKMLSLGITLPKCDVVFLMNNSMSADAIMQKMYRCMSETTDGSKKYGFVIDLNISRVLHSCISYNVHKKNMNVDDKIRYLITNHLINIDSDLMDNKEIDSNRIINKLIEIWKDDPVNNLKSILKHLENEVIELDTDDQKRLNKYFTKSLTKVNVSIGMENSDDEQQDIQTGKEKEKVKNDDDDAVSNSSKASTTKNEEKTIPINFTRDVLYFVIPLTSLLTLKDNNKDFCKMLCTIKENKELLEVFDEQSFVWWGQKGLIDMIEKTVSKYIDKNSLTYNTSINFKMSLQSLIDKPSELLEYINECLKPKTEEKKQFGEVFTPMKLVNEMLDKLDECYMKEHNKSIFEIRDFKWFDPANGMGNFLIAVYMRLIQHHDKKHILENMLYSSELNKKNNFIYRQIMNFENEFMLNINEGNTLELDIKKKWYLNGFDVIVSNPPYNDGSGNKGKGHTLWVGFVEMSLDKWINESGYLLFINPSLWRQADNQLQKTIKQYQIEYLEIHDETDGVKTFRCNTRYDWYIINKKPYYKNTEIKTQKGEIVCKNLSKMNFIPNYNYELIDKLTSGNKPIINLIESRSAYGHDKPWVSKTQNDVFKYPVVYSINRKNEPQFHYSAKNTNGHFGEHKVIFSSGATGFIIDNNGEYGLTQWSVGIIDSIEHLPSIKTVLESKQFRDEIVLATSVSKAEINRKILKYFNKDFWKEFV